MEQLNRESHLSGKGYSTSEDYLSKPRHRWYYYKEGFSNELVEHAINEANLTKEDIIFDPFVGSGTVNLSASQNKINSIGIEVNPFAFFLSQTKHINSSDLYLKKGIERDFSFVSKGIEVGKKSPFLKFSTFSEYTGKDKWLFNSNILNSFEGGYSSLENVSKQYQGLFKLALLNAAMDNCNAKKDGKCLRYKKDWDKRNFNKDSFFDSFNQHFKTINDDLKSDFLCNIPKFYKSDSRKFLQEHSIPFKLCVSSPPYLNSFDYTDVYRPELFLGRFIKSQLKLKELRTRTLCSHTNITSTISQYKNNSILYKKIISDLNTHSGQFWNNKLSQMVQSYFEQMEGILKRLFEMGKSQSQIWLVVANSAYFNCEIPTDLILADIGSKVGWKLKEIRVLRDVFKRGSKYSPDINSLRESVIILQKQ